MPDGNTSLECDVAYEIFYLFGEKKKEGSCLKEDVMKNFEIYEM